MRNFFSSNFRKFCSILDVNYMHSKARALESIIKICLFYSFIAPKSNFSMDKKMRGKYESLLDDQSIMCVKMYIYEL